ncbi:MAG: glycosyltransferase family 4 protein, partial [Pseudomonadota bacterium]|nr:glycosyltransferase family 4 protein [Pseudomonadota bacterium]
SELQASFAAERPTLVASHFALYAVPVLDRLRALPLVTHFHGPWALESGAEGASRSAVLAKMGVEQLVYRRSDRIIAMSEAFRQILLRRYRLPEHKVDMVPNGVDTAAFDLLLSRDAARERLGWEPGRSTVFTVRRLVRRMGLDRLITAWAEMRAQGHGLDAILHIAGKGPERVVLERQVTEMGLSACIRFDGLISDEALRLSYRAADLTVIPTAALEGFGLIAAESLAAGTPVLTTPVGGLPEVVSGLSTAMVLGGITARDIAAGLSATLADPGRMPSSSACREYAQRTYDWTVIAPKVAASYRSML